MQGGDQLSYLGQREAFRVKSENMSDKTISSEQLSRWISLLPRAHVVYVRP